MGVEGCAAGAGPGPGHYQQQAGRPQPILPLPEVGGLCGQTLRLQRRLFRAPDRELSRAEYGRLLSAARSLGRERLCLLMEAVCATGIRVSEVKYLTVEAARRGRAEVALKGKSAPS